MAVSLIFPIFAVSSLVQSLNTFLPLRDPTLSEQAPHQYPLIYLPSQEFLRRPVSVFLFENFLEELIAPGQKGALEKPAGVGPTDSTAVPFLERIWLIFKR